MPLILAILLNLNWLKSPYIGVILSLLYLIIFGYLLGKLLFKDNDFCYRLILGLFFLFSLYSFLGAIVYFIYQLNLWAINVIFLVISFLIIYFNSLQIDDRIDIKLFWEKCLQKIKSSFSLFNQLKFNLLNFSFIILLIVLFVILFRSQTIEAIRTPWQVIPSSFFIIYFLLAINLLLLLFLKNSKTHNIFISSFFLITLSLALIIYKFGYGFDTFIHQATEAAIFSNGQILPKPFYYLGQYSLVIIFSRLFSLPVETIDKLLLPLLASTFLPFIIYSILNKTFSIKENFTKILSLAFLFIPFSIFIVTTPSGLANLYLLIILWLSFLYLKNKQIPFSYLIFLSLVALAIHALAGIPILIYLILVWLFKNQTIAAKIIRPIFSLLACLFLPLALFINSLFSIYKIEFNWQNLGLINWPTIFSKQFNYFIDIAYLYKNCIHLLILLITLVTLYNIIKHHKTSIFLPSLLTFLILIANAIFLNFIKVSQIINYEQGEFSQRIFQLSFYFLLPTLILGIYLILDKIQAKPFIVKSFLIVLFSGFITCSLYLSYPRFDDYDNSKFINVSQADFAAVNFIEQNANGQPYIVLSNQMTSAAALKTFGFTKYYNGQYFYPIPTGGELYKYFEQMIYQTPDKEVMAKAMDFTGVNISYFVLPTYWSRFEIITGESKKYADAIYSLDDKIMIFKYFK